MQEEKKYYKTARAKANKKYISELEALTVRVPKGQRAYYQQMAKKSGESLNAFTIRALNYLIKVEGLERSEEE